VSTTDPPQGATGRCAYLVSRYPLQTHTFILNEVRAMRDAGVHIETISIRRVPPEALLSEADRREFERTHALLPVAPAQLARAHARALRRGPLAYLRVLASALRSSHGGARATLWQLFYFGEAVLLWAWLEDRGLRHIHVHHANVSSDVALLACRFANVAGPGDAERWTWSVTVHGPAEFVDVPGYKLQLKAEAADAVICVSDFARSQLLSIVGASAGERLHTVHCGVDMERFSPRAPTHHEGPMSVLTVAQLAPRKGLDVLLDAVALLRARDVPVEAVIVGDGDQRRHLETRARDLGLEDVVTFAGAVGQDRIPDYYAGADVFCLPSFAEGIPIVLMEAMARQLPVVATAVMGVPELVVDRRSGLLVPPARADLLADALEELAHDPALRERLGVEARKHVAEGFELHSVVAQLLGVLGPLIAKPTAGA
jgi:glycosyltransferase involved in cell wall biosynthesis